MNLRSVTVPALSAACLLLACCSLRADVVFSNITGPHGGGYSIGGTTPLVTQSLAAAFTPGANYSLTDAQAELAGTLIGGTVQFAIYSNDPTRSVPLLSLDRLGSVTVGPNDNTRFTANTPATPLTLLSGTEYWLVLTPGAAGTFAVWDAGGSSSPQVANTHDPSGATGWTNPGDLSSQFQIDGTPPAPSVPEPATAWLLCLALAGLVAFHRARARGAIRPESDRSEG